MAQSVVVHGFETSNNMKVRIGLGYKGIPFEFRTIDPADRSEIERISGQFFTPVLVHGDTVLFDSGAILRYLDANWRDTPRLFGGSYPEQRAIEGWEGFARTVLAAPMMELVMRRVMGGTVDDELRERCGQEFARATDELSEALDGRDWLVGDALSAADVTAAAVCARIRSSGMLPAPPAFEAIGGWVDRVVAHDPGP
jgi:glutathione S-transferase